MNKAVTAGLVVAVLVIGAGWWWLSGKPGLGTVLAPPGAPPTAQVAAPDPEPVLPSAPLFPLPDARPMVEDTTQPPDAPPLPALANSDAELMAEARRAGGSLPLDAWLVPGNLVRRFVATVDNLPGTKLPMQLRALRKVDGGLAVVPDPSGETYLLADENQARYRPVVELLTSLDAPAFVALYRRYYPLFQSAYQELGSGGRYFNDRLVQVIDHLLDAPEVLGPIQLVRPKVFYQYADPGLEELSAGQKIMLRVGPDNAARLKLKLSELRTLLVTQPPAG